jgi:surfeit locus 1 family protein
MTAARGTAALAAALLLFAAFVALGTWQLQRRVWKRDLIARVESRVHAPASPAPARSEWSTVSRPRDEYRHVQLTGEFLGTSTTLVQATTELGAGYWVLEALRLEGGGIVWINRGFVTDRPTAPPAGIEEVTRVTGLLRMSEPRGAFLRRNDPAAGRWYSRDVQAISAARHLVDVAPFFVDEDARREARRDVGRDARRDARRDPGQDALAGGDRADVPVGGLTVISFYNSHLVYAVTWYTLALMVPAGAWIVLRHRRSR